MNYIGVLGETIKLFGTALLATFVLILLLSPIILAMVAVSVLGISPWIAVPAVVAVFVMNVAAFVAWVTT